MKLSHPEISKIFDFDCGKLNTVIIENQHFMFDFLIDIAQQIGGNCGKSVLSENSAPIEWSKYAEILDSFIPFELNRKSLLPKIASAVEKQALSPEHYDLSMKIIGEIEEFLDTVSLDFPCDIVYPKMSISSLIKSASPELNDDAVDISDKILNYMELVYEFDKRKLFITVNLRSYITDEEAELFAKTVISHGYCILMVEADERKKLSNENRLIIDGDLCEIS